MDFRNQETNLKELVEFVYEKCKKRLRTKIEVRRALPYCALRSLGCDTDLGARESQDPQNAILNLEKFADLARSASIADLNTTSTLGFAR